MNCPLFSSRSITAIPATALMLVLLALVVVAPAQQPAPADAALKTFKLQHRTAGDLAPQVQQLLAGDPSIGVFVSEATNEIVVRAPGAQLALAEQIITRLDQPVAMPAPKPAALETYRIETNQRPAIERWLSNLPQNDERRIAWDDRTGQLLLFATPTTHAALQGQLSGATPLAASAIAPLAAPIAAAQPAAQPFANQAELQLQSLTPVELHQRLERLAGRPLPATWDNGNRWLSFPVRLGDSSGVTVRVDATRRVVQMAGSSGETAAWREVVKALDATPTATDSSTRLVATNKAAEPKIKQALSAIGSRSGKSQPKPGKFVTMLMQATKQKADQNGQTSEADNAPAVGPGLQAAIAGNGEDESSLLGPVQIEFIEGLDVIVVRGNKEDVERVMKIINQIETLSEVTVPEIEILPLKHVDSESMGELMARVYEDVLGPRTGGVSITPLGKPDALLLIGRSENVSMAKKLVERLDQPVDPASRFEMFPLKHASAADAKMLIDEFLDQATETNQEDSLVALTAKALVVADFRSNSLIVRAAPRDLAEVRLLLAKIDTGKAGAVDEVRVFPLKNSLAEDLAEVLRSAISQTAAEGADDNAAPRSTGLSFSPQDTATMEKIESGILTSVRIASDARANTLIITAPADSMELIAALIAQLDRTADAEAKLKVFAVANGDAVALAEMLRSLFGDGTDEEGGGLGAASSPLAPLQISVDERTNSIIAAGGEEDLAVVEAILLRLDQGDARERETRVYRLNNARAEEVANSLNQLIQNQRDAEEAADLAISPFEQIDRDIIVVFEAATNSLIISASPDRFEDISKLIKQLDERPPMVMIQVLIAEVRLNDTDEFGLELGLQDSLLFDRSLVGELNSITTTTNTQSPGGATVSVQEQTIINQPLTPGFNFNDVQNPIGNNLTSAALATAGNVATQSLSNFGVGRVNSELGFGGFVFAASSNSVSMLLRALQESRRLEVLSRPQIMALDNQQGIISVGQRVPRIESVGFTPTGQQQNQVTYEDVGIILDVTPRISPDGMVVMTVGAEKSQVGNESEGIPIFAAAGGAVVRAPRIDQTVAQTTVAAASGQTVVLSGLLTKETFDIHRRVPLLADIPLLGDLFRFDSVSEQRTELLIIMTPRVIRSQDDAEMIKQVESARMSWVMCDVVNMHGPSGLRNRCDDWSDSEAEAVYPTYVPNDGELVPSEAMPLQQPGEHVFEGQVWEGASQETPKKPIDPAVTPTGFHGKTFDGTKSRKPSLAKRLPWIGK